MRDSRRLHHQQLQLAERLSNASTTTVGLGGYDMDLGATAATMAATQAHASTKKSAHALRSGELERKQMALVDPP